MVLLFDNMNRGSGAVSNKSVRPASGRFGVRIPRKTFRSLKQVVTAQLPNAQH